MRSSQTTLQIAINVTAMLILFALITMTFQPVFGGWRFFVAGVGGAVLGIVIGLLTSRGSLQGWLYTAAGVVLAYVLFGVQLAVPSTALWHVLPSFEGLRELMLGAVFSWKGLLTAEPPAEGFPSLLVVPFLTMLLCASVATTLALRLRRHASFALIPVLIALVVGITFGTKIASFPVAVGVALAGVAVAWLAWRSKIHRDQLAKETELEVTAGRRLRKDLERKRFLGAIAMLALASIGAAGVGQLVNPAGRNVLRDVVEPPIELADYPSPLAGYRGWLKNYSDETLMTVSGMPADARLGLATMDYHNGEVYTVGGADNESAAGSFARVGDVIGVQQSGEEATVSVNIEGYSGIWLPSTGFAQSIEFEGDRQQALQTSLAYNGATGSAIVLNGLQAGDAYELHAIVPQNPDVDDLKQATISDVAVPKPASIPDEIQAWASEHGTNGSTTMENITAMQIQLQKGAFSHGLENEITSLAGHSSFRMDSMFKVDSLVGDDEQYAVAFAFALQYIGVPARVVMGMYPDDGFESGSVELTGDDMHAWVEIPIEGFGWVPFDATPPEDQTQIEPDPVPKPEPKPQVLQPPQPIEEPVELTPEVQPDGGEIDDEEEGFDWWPIVMVSLIVLLSILLLLSPFIIIGLMKLSRRKKRRQAEDPSARLAGGWHEIVDQAVDLGLEVPRGVTRTRVAAHVSERYPQSRASDIGQYVDAGVFGPQSPPEDEVETFWSDVDRSVEAMRHEASFWDRLKSRLSVRSFMRNRSARRRTR